MNINVKTEKTYTVSDITETQAQALLDLASDLFNDEIAQEYWAGTDIPETLNDLRQALLNAGVTKSKGGQ